jgi:hypothetical protein
MGHSVDENIGKGEFLESIIFSVGEYDWSIWIYPKGNRKAENDEVSMFLYLNCEAECVKAQVCSAIIDQSGSACHLVKQRK